MKDNTLLNQAQKGKGIKFFHLSLCLCAFKSRLWKMVR